MKNASNNPFWANRSLPAIFAVGTGLAALPASALELGELTVHSRLGQPLRASIAYALAPNEQISNYCVTMRPGPSVSGLPGFGPATVSVANGVIMLTGSTPVREPMVAAHVVINCPYSANLSREYQLFIDPLIPAYEQTNVTQQAAPASAPIAVAEVAVQSPVASVRTTAVVRDITVSTEHRVAPGDTLSDIASRIQNRPVGLWPAVNAIFAANPHAFIGNDPNRLIAGSVISIPDFGGVAAVAMPAESAAAIPIDEPIIEDSVAAEHTVDAVLKAYTAGAAGAETSTPESAAIDLDELAETDVTASVAATNIIIDADLEGPATASSSPNVSTAIITSRPVSEPESTPWLFWLAGSGIAIILGLLMFGRRFRSTADTAPLAPVVEQPHRRRFSDLETTDTKEVPIHNVDYDLTDDSPTEENLALDADLVMGTGLDEGTSNVSNFGFAENSTVDVELPFEPVASISEETDIQPQIRTGEHSILDSEMMPEDGDDYDMSVIVDATNMPQAEDVTERDLKAVEIATDDTQVTANYTIDEEVDFEVLEQDYEDEFTATQALNLEIARAAAELAESMEDKDSADDDRTEAMPLASVTELDVTAQMPAQNDDLSLLDDPDATGVNETLTATTATGEDTVEMPAKSGKGS